MGAVLVSGFVSFQMEGALTIDHLPEPGALLGLQTWHLLESSQRPYERVEQLLSRSLTDEDIEAQRSG